MPKISRIRPCEYNKSCSTCHQKSNKIKFAFVWIFCDFLRILQVSAIWKHYWRYILRWGPWKELGPSNVALGHGRQRGRPNSGDSDEGIGREIVGGGARAHLGLIWAGFGVREAGGGRGQRRGPEAAAAASIPARRREVPSNARCFELLWGLGEVLGRSSGWGIEQGRGLARRRPWRLGGAARPWHCRPFYRCARWKASMLRNEGRWGTCRCFRPANLPRGYPR
jgi:hypothetical protein